MARLEGVAKAGYYPTPTTDKLYTGQQRETADGIYRFYNGDPSTPRRVGGSGWLETQGAE